VHTILGVVLVASFAFLGTMFDNFFAFAAQLVVTEPTRFRRVGWAHALAIATIVVLASGLGSLLAPIPLRWIGLLCVAPFAFAWHSWRHRSTAREQFRRGSVTTFALTMGLGGDNLAVWIPLFRANGFAHASLTVVTFALWEIVFLFSAIKFATHPRIVRWGNEHASTFMPYLYVMLGFLILIECRTI
jgi:cadmium resistance protein CadD (predicted permease)